MKTRCSRSERRETRGESSSARETRDAYGSVREKDERETREPRAKTRESTCTQATWRRVCPLCRAQECSRKSKRALPSTYHPVDCATEDEGLEERKARDERPVEQREERDERRMWKMCA